MKIFSRILFAILVFSSLLFVSCEETPEEVNPTTQTEITTSDEHLFETADENARSSWSSVKTRTSYSTIAGFSLKAKKGKQIMVGVKNNDSSENMVVSLRGVNGPSHTTYYVLSPGQTKTYVYTATSSRPHVSVRYGRYGKHKVVSYAYQYSKYSPEYFLRNQEMVVNML